jgi:hypothetical protein
VQPRLAGNVLLYDLRYGDFVRNGRVKRANRAAAFTECRGGTVEPLSFHPAFVWGV